MTGESAASKSLKSVASSLVKKDCIPAEEREERINAVKKALTVDGMVDMPVIHQFMPDVEEVGFVEGRVLVLASSPAAGGIF